SLLEGTFFVAWWNTWRIRNRIIFEGVLPRRSEQKKLTSIRMVARGLPILGEDTILDDLHSLRTFMVFNLDLHTIKSLMDVQDQITHTNSLPSCLLYFLVFMSSAICFYILFLHILQPIQKFEKQSNGCTQEILVDPESNVVAYVIGEKITPNASGVAPEQMSVDFYSHNSLDGNWGSVSGTLFVTAIVKLYVLCIYKLTSLRMIDSSFNSRISRGSLK
nr:hypothetical protein [Tanacetum cinerariifolium]